MRLWTIHPCYLDTAGLNGCWRESLLAKKVLEGKTKGYKNHPQLIRFKNSEDPILAIDIYIGSLLLESAYRGFSYHPPKSILTISHKDGMDKISVSEGQIAYEAMFLVKKLKDRKSTGRKSISPVNNIEICELFESVPGDIENWEKINE